jgi:hypothetical protein
MPCPPELLKRVDEAVDSWLKRRDSASNEDKPPRNPLAAPQQFLADSPPQKIHGKPDQELWPPKPRVPIPIETL